MASIRGGRPSLRIGGLSVATIRCHPCPCRSSALRKLRHLQVRREGNPGRLLLPRSEDTLLYWMEIGREITGPWGSPPDEGYNVMGKRAKILMLCLPVPFLLSVLIVTQLYLHPPESALVSSILVHVPFSPEAQTALFACAADQNAGNFRVIDSRNIPDGRIIAYTVDCLRTVENRQDRSLLGYALVIRDPRALRGLAWQYAGGGTIVDRVPAPGELALGHSGGDHYALLFGRVHDPDIAFVEARFSDGQVVRGAITEGVFVAIASDLAAACELRLSSTNGQLLRRVDREGLPPLMWSGRGPLPSNLMAPNSQAAAFQLADCPNGRGVRHE